MKIKTQVGDNQSKAGDKVQLHHTLADWICKVEVKKPQNHFSFLFYFRNQNTRICSRNVSKSAVEEYLKQRYTKYNSCSKPCTVVDIQSTLVSKSKSESSNPRLMFMFGKTVAVSRDVLAYSSLNLVAELGGYLGLTLGLSLMHLEMPLRLIWQKLVAWRKR